jgi:hypothetical protein
MPQTTFEQSFLAIKKLVADFRENSWFYLTAAYQEQEARHDFIDKLFIALGWDFNHNIQKNPYTLEISVPIIRQIGAER